MTPRAYALEVIATLREEASIVRYVTASQQLAFEGKREQGVAASEPPRQSERRVRDGVRGATLATPSPIHIYVRRRGRPSRRGAEQRSGKFARLLFVAVAAPIVFVLLLLQELALWISGHRRPKGQD